MSIITTFVDRSTPPWAERLAVRCQRAAVTARTALGAVVAWARSRVEAAKADERGLETAEIVLISSIVLVTVAFIGAAINTWLNGKLSQIIRL